MDQFKISEATICKHFGACLKVAHQYHVLPDSFVYAHVDNGQRSGDQLGRIITGKKAKAMGVNKGFPDYVFSWGWEDGRNDHGFIEFKTTRGNLSAEQIQFRASCERVGIKYGLARSVKDGVQFLQKWGVIKPTFHVF
jgi:hypothetical protein